MTDSFQATLTERDGVRAGVAAALASAVAQVEHGIADLTDRLENLSVRRTLRRHSNVIMLPPVPSPSGTIDLAEVRASQIRDPQASGTRQ